MQNNPPIKPGTMSEKEAAEFLGISPRKLWGMRASGDIPFMRCGTRVLYPVDALQRWITEQTEGGGA